MQNVLGFACLAIYYCSFYFDKNVREQYRYPPCPLKAAFCVHMFHPDS